MANLLTTSSIASWLSGVLNGISLWIDGLIYYFVALTYKVFYLVAQANLFGDAELKVITDRVYLVLGVAMLFVFAYNILVLIAFPDKLSNDDDKSLKRLAYNMVISIVLLTLLPTIFNYAHLARQSILNSNVIGNIILGGWSDADTQYSISEAGTNTALLILGAFYHPIVNGEDVSAVNCAQLIANGEQGVNDICTEYLASYIQAQETSNLRALTSNGVLIDGIYNGSMEYLAILSWIGGIFAAYLFLSFSIDVGVRIAKFAFLQLIAPVPVVLRITKPSGGTYSRWYTQITKTFFDIFIRLAFIYFVMYMITLIPTVIVNVFKAGFTGTGGGIIGSGFGIVQLLATAILILGCLQFAKDGPDMVYTMFAIDKLEINIKKKLGENEYAMRAATGIGAMATGGIGNAIRSYRDGGTPGNVLGSGLMGAAGGARHGWKAGGNVKDPTKIGDAVREGRADADEAALKREERIRGFGDFLDDPSGEFATWRKDFADDLAGYSPKFYDSKLGAYKGTDGHRSTLMDEIDDKSKIRDLKDTRSKARTSIMSRERDNEVEDFIRRTTPPGTAYAGAPVAAGTPLTQAQLDAGRRAYADSVVDSLNADIKQARSTRLGHIINGTPGEATAAEQSALNKSIDSMISSMKENSHLMEDDIKLFRRNMEEERANVDKKAQVAALGRALTAAEIAAIDAAHVNTVNSLDDLASALRDTTYTEASVVMLSDLMEKQLKYEQQEWSAKKYEAQKKS